MTRSCLRHPGELHRATDPVCDCLRTEIPVEARAMSSGALGAPDRNHACEECCGSGKTLRWSGFMCSEVRCLPCAGTGSIRVDGSPGVQS